MALSQKGIDVRQTGTHLMFRAFLQDVTGTIVTTGTTSLYLYEVQSDGTFKSYDFNDNTFKTTALTTETQALTHRTGNNTTTNTGIWTYPLTTLSGFTVGGIYLARVSNSGASPTDQVREFQYGSHESDLVTTAGATGVATLQADVIKINSSATAAVNQAALAAAPETGTATAGGASTITLRAGANATDNYYKDQAIVIVTGTGAVQTNRISSYVGATKVATVSTAWVTQPDNTSVYILLGRIG